MSTTDLWSHDPKKPYQDPLSGRMLTRPIGQRVCVKGHAFNGVIRNKVHGKREMQVYQVEHDNGEVLDWPWHALKDESPMEALAKMDVP